MDGWQIAGLYLAGLGLAVAECFTPGLILGALAAVALSVSIFYGFNYNPGVGAGQVVLMLVILPVAFQYGMKRLALKVSLAGSRSFAQDYDKYQGQEGEAHTELRPAGIVVVGNEKIDVVTGGELIERGRRVKVVKVEGNRIVVRAI